MRVLVYGAGAVGGYLGARLCQHGHDVTLIARPTTAAAIQSQGLAVTEDGQTVRTHPRLATSVAQAFMNQAAAYDLIILGMKSYDLVESLDPLVAFCPQPPMLVTTQNGIGVERPLIEQFGPEHVLAGSFTIPVRKETTHSLVAERTDGGFALAPTQAGQAIGQWQTIGQWQQLFKEAGVNAVVVKDYQAMKWSKALLNIVANASCAILNRSPETIYKSDIIYDLELRMIKEALAVMKVLKLKVVDLPGPSIPGFVTGVKRLPKLIFRPILINKVVSGRGEKMPSFYMDLAAGKGKSEVLFHNGAIAEAGAANGVATPVNRALSDILLKLTREEIDWREFDGKPKRLLAEVRQYE
ncbi:MAG: ketopantoate reductase family protein [Anaerolineales bacterium]|nr:ketopantoate reductase family protein [Anaerolineales bacterium]